jgi:hypothetical protein
MGVEQAPDTIEAAIAAYTSAGRGLEDRLGVTVSDELGREVRRALQGSGYRV